MNFQLISDYIPQYCTLTLLQICFAKLLIEKKKNSVALETGLCSRKGIQYLHFFLLPDITLHVMLFIF